MPKKPLSITLESDNILWLRGRSLSDKRRSLSETLDAVVSAARQGGDARSVVGTVDIAGIDDDLSEADEAVRAVYRSSLERPVLVRETPPTYSRRKRGGTRG